MAENITLASLVAVLRLTATGYRDTIRQVVQDTQRGTNVISSAWRDVNRSTTRVSNGMRNFHKVTRGAMKDMARIIQGILVSQVFYRLLRAIQDSIRSVFAFAASMERATISFTKLLGTKALAESYLRILEDMAATTPIQLEPLRDASQQLLAMGFHAKNLIPILRTVVDTVGGVGGTQEQFNTIIRSLGRIRGVGILSARELRSLASANIPIYEILQKQLKLTEEQMAQIGKLRIPAERAIQAILRGLSEEFSGLAQFMSQTFTGLVSTLKDNFLFLGRDVFLSTFEDIKGGLKSLLSTVQEWRIISRDYGIGGLFEFLVPPNLRTSMRIFLMSFKQTSIAVWKLIQAFAPLIDTVGTVLVNAFAAIAPIITRFVDLLTRVVTWALRNQAVVRLLALAISRLLIASVVSTVLLGLVKVLRLLGITGLISTLVRDLAAALKLLYVAASSHPIVAIITAIAGVMLYLALSTKNAANWIASLNQRLATMFGYNIDQFLQPRDPKQIADSFQDYTKMVKEVGDAAEEVGDQIKKFIAPFDEIINIAEATKKQFGDFGDLGDLGDLGDFGGSEPPTIPEPPIESPRLNILQKWKEDFQRIWEAIVAIPFIIPFDWPPFPPMPVVDLDKALEAIVTSLIVAKGKWEGLWQELLSQPSLILDQMTIRLRSASSDLQTAFTLQPVLDSINAFWRDFSNTAISPLTSISEIIKIYVEDWTSNLTMPSAIEAFKIALTTMQKFWSGLWDTMPKKLDNFLVWLQQVFTLDAARNILARAQDSIQLNWQNLWDGVPEPVQDFLTWLREVFTLDAARNTLSGALSSVYGVWISLKEKVSSLLGGLDEAITRGWQLLNPVQTLKEALSSVYGAWMFLKERISSLLRGLNEAITRWWQLLSPVQMLQEALGSVYGVWISLKEKVSSLLGGLDEAITRGWQLLNPVQTLKEALSSVYGAWMFLKERISSLLRGLDEAITRWWQLLDPIQILKEAMGRIKSLWKEHNLEIITLMGLLILAIVSTFAGLPASLTASFAALVAVVLTNVITPIKQNWNNMIYGPGGLIGMLQSSLSRFKEVAKNIYTAIARIFTKPIKMAIDLATKKTFSTRAATNFGSAAYGGIINSNGLLEVGEHQRKEVVVPLQNTTAMRPYAQAVATEMNAIRRGSNVAGGELSGGGMQLNIGVLVADKAGLMELEKRLRIIREQEDLRRGRSAGFTT